MQRETIETCLAAIKNVLITSRDNKKYKTFYKNESGNIVFLFVILCKLYQKKLKPFNTLIKQIFSEWSKLPVCASPFTIYKATEIANSNVKVSLSTESVENLEDKRDWNYDTVSMTLKWMESRTERDENKCIDFGTKLLTKIENDKQDSNNLNLLTKHGQIKKCHVSKIYFVTHLIYIATAYGTEKIKYVDFPLNLCYRLLSAWLLTFTNFIDRKRESNNNKNMVRDTLSNDSLEVVLEIATSLLILEQNGCKLGTEIEEILRHELKNLIITNYLSRATLIEQDLKKRKNSRHPLHVEYHTHFLVGFYLALVHF